jgi:hypothetical protein
MRKIGECVDEFKRNFFHDFTFPSNLAELGLPKILLACAYYQQNKDKKEWLPFWKNFVLCDPDLHIYFHSEELGERSYDKASHLILNFIGMKAGVDYANTVSHLSALLGVEKPEEIMAESPEGGMPYTIQIPISTLDSKKQEICCIIESLSKIEQKPLPTHRFNIHEFKRLREELLDKYNVSFAQTDFFEELLLAAFGVPCDLTTKHKVAVHDFINTIGTVPGFESYMQGLECPLDMLCVGLEINEDQAREFKEQFNANFPRLPFPNQIFYDYGKKIHEGRALERWGFLLNNENLKKLFKMLEATLIREYVTGSLNYRLKTYQEKSEGDQELQHRIASRRLQAQYPPHIHVFAPRPSAEGTRPDENTSGDPKLTMGR